MDFVALKNAGIKKTVMLTGDSKEVAEKVANDIGIDEIYSELLPSDKVNKLEEVLNKKVGNGKGTTYDKVCSTCRGVGKINKVKEIEVKVPAGVDNGNQLRVAGKGEAGYNGGPNGDLYIEFKVTAHPIFEREEDDIYLFLPITIVDSVLGCKRDVPTIDGTIKLTIPENSKTGDKLRVKGKGVPNVNSGKRGDMYVVLNVLPPSKVSREQKSLLEKLRETDLEDNKEFKKIKEYL